VPVSAYFKGRGRRVMREMKDRYGDKAGERVFYATAAKRGQGPDGESTRKALRRRRKHKGGG
jgi:hypothetical protein